MEVGTLNGNEILFTGNSENKSEESETIELREKISKMQKTINRLKRTKNDLKRMLPGGSCQGKNYQR